VPAEVSKSDNLTDICITPVGIDEETRVRRRDFIAAIGAACAGAPVEPQAQPINRSIVVLGPSEEPRFSQIVSGLRLGLRDRGYAALHILEAKVERGNLDFARTKVEEAVAHGVTLLVVIGSALVPTARQAAPNSPIVFISPGDPVAAGLVASLARPGGNMTAITFEYPELSAKRLELLKSLAPSIRKVLVLHDPRDASPRQGLAALRDAAPRLQIQLIEREARSNDEIDQGLALVDQADALIAVPGGVTSAHFAKMVRAANARRIPSIFHSRSETTLDALASYGASDSNIARDAARFVEKILNGERRRRPAG
jgi:putative tryptophan/tyrosine transport system substrate-binding protein